MNTISEFLAMGGYAGFVWPAFAVAAVILIGLLINTLRTLRAREAALLALEAESPGRRGRGAGQKTGQDPTSATKPKT